MPSLTASVPSASSSRSWANDAAPAPPFRCAPRRRRNRSDLVYDRSGKSRQTIPGQKARRHSRRGRASPSAALRAASMACSVPMAPARPPRLRMLATILSAHFRHRLRRRLRYPPRARKRSAPTSGFLSTATALYGRLTAREMVEYFGRLYGLDEPTAAPPRRRLFDRLECTDFRRSPLRQRSPPA